MSKQIFRSRAGGRDKRVGVIMVIDGEYMLIATRREQERAAETHRSKIMIRLPDKAGIAPNVAPGYLRSPNQRRLS